MARKKKQRIDAASASGFGNSLGDKLRAVGLSNSETAASTPAMQKQQTGSDTKLKAIGTVVVRLQRKGRRGKTVTLVEGLGPVSALSPFASKISKALGCGCSVEDSIIVVQGDHGDRLASLLQQYGFDAVSRGS